MKAIAQSLLAHLYWPIMHTGQRMGKQDDYLLLEGGDVGNIESLVIQEIEFAG
jgi:hypothetical protein